MYKRVYYPILPIYPKIINALCDVKSMGHSLGNLGYFLEVLSFIHSVPYFNHCVAKYLASVNVRFL